MIFSPYWSLIILRYLKKKLLKDRHLIKTVPNICVSVVIEGVKGTGTTSNNTIEVERVLGIEAARFVVTK